MKLLRSSLCASTFALSAALFAPVASADDGFMDAKPIEGDSVQKGFEKAIQIQGLSFSVTSPSSLSASSGITAGRPTFSAITVTKATDKATLGLFKAAASGQVLPSVVFSLRKGSAGSPTGASVYFRITLTNAVVTGFKFADANITDSSGPKEELQISFARMQLEVFAQDARGAFTPAGKYFWDLGAAKGG